ncbi:MAG: glycine zipper 2TM domain-containing protein, partial [Rhodovibrionaceae bacterium]|nr:glycine zipper 2TM domain-containing protein [Rhodovibrionaceae bacterium]
MRRGLLAGVLAGCLAVSACATPDSDTYTSSDVGQTIETSQGRVLSSRPVDIKSEEGGTAGTLAGGAVGGAAGYGVGSGSGQLLATVIGAVVGASIGYLAEKEIRSGEGIEYIVELEDGRVVTLVQNRAGDEQPIADGEPVLVQFGSQYTRIRALDSDSTGAVTGSGAGS